METLAAIAAAAAETGEALSGIREFFATAGYIALCVLMFSVAIAIHEFGHFIVALKLGLRVERFSIGFGPAIWKRKWRGVEYMVCWIPLGGYVMIPDLDPAGTKVLEGGENREEGRGKREENAGNGEWGTGNGERRKIPAWKEIVVAFAGPAMNIVLAVILAVVISLVPSDRFGTTPAVVGEVISDGPAEKAGIKPGDRIVSVAGRPIASWNELQTEVQIVGDKEAEFVLDRGGEEVSVRVTPERDKVSGACMISAVSETHPEGLPGRWLPSRNPWEQLKYDAGGIFRVLKGLVTPKEMKETGKAIGGPVMIAQGIYYSMRADFLNGMGFFRFLNVNLAIINLLPIPVLDGGLILFALIALVFRRRVPEKVVNSLTMVFMCLLLTLMAFLIYRDSARAWRMHKAEKAEEAEVVRKPAPPPAAAEGQDGGADRSRGAGGDVKDADKGTD